MTAETDAIIAYFRASGVAGLATDINSPGAHVLGSCHYWNGTWAPPHPPDRSRGGEGCAVDFAFVPPQWDSPQLHAVFDAFAKVSDQLVELIHSGAPFFVSHGKQYPITQLARPTFATHHNHVHVAVRKGTFLRWNGPSVTPSPVPTPGEIMQPYITVPCPTGGYWELKTDDGGVGAYDGARFYGSYPSIARGTPANAPFVSLTPFVQGNEVKGYWLCGMDGGVFAFGAAPFLGSYASHPDWGTPGAVIVGLVQTGGFHSGETATYRLLRHAPDQGDYAFAGYNFPLAG